MSGAASALRGGRLAAAAVVALLGLVLVWVLGASWQVEPEPPPVEVVEVEEDLEPMPPGTVALGVVIRPGSTLGALLGEHGLPVHPIREAALEHHDLAMIRPGRELMVIYRQGEERPAGVRYEIDEDRTVVVERQGEAWEARLEEVEYDVALGTRDLVLQRSLWQDGLEAGLRPPDLLRLARIFEYELDFNSELRRGARFSLVAEELTAPGRRPRLGTIHAARIDNEGRVTVALRHEVDGDEGYYHPDGSGMRRPFLRSPLEFSARVTSGFNPNRFHPILKTNRPHNGVDFGAPTGTPVRTVADGRVVFAGRNRGHGNFVKIEHDRVYTTSYSHLHRIHVRQGQRVRQGDHIGDVGMTGLATGPHLHYQMWVNGRFVDPMRVELPRTAPLPAGQREAFEAEARRWLAKLPGAEEEPTR